MQWQDPPLDPLSRLAIKYGTDKYGQHLYTPIYHRLFGHLREEPLRILEIGVGWPQVACLGGASLCMWRDYFPYATLVGLDLQPKTLDLGPRVTILQGSQSDVTFLNKVWDQHGPFDIVIDDGSHRVTDVLTSFEALYPRLPEDGVYAIEDTQTAFWPEFGGNPHGAGTVMTRLQDVIQAMHAPEVRAAGQAAPLETFGDITASVQVYRNLVVFERGANTYPSNRAMDLADPGVQEVMERMAEEQRRDPSEGEILTRIGMLEVAGQVSAAYEVARQGVQTYPTSAGLLCVGQHLARHMGRAEESRALLLRLLELAPQEPILQQIEQQTRPG